MSISQEAMQEREQSNRIVPSAPVLCSSCREKIVQWMQEYEQALDAQVRTRLHPGDHLALSLHQIVAAQLQEVRSLLEAGLEAGQDKAGQDREARPCD